jgi:hypothetical protein
VLAVICAGVEPEQILCALLVMLFEAMSLFTVTCIDELSLNVQAPDDTRLLNHVVCVNAPGV